MSLWLSWDSLCTVWYTGLTANRVIASGGFSSSCLYMVEIGAKLQENYELHILTDTHGKSPRERVIAFPEISDPLLVMIGHR